MNETLLVEPWVRFVVRTPVCLLINDEDTEAGSGEGTVQLEFENATKSAKEELQIGHRNGSATNGGRRV